MAVLNTYYNVQTFSGDTSVLKYPLSLYNNPNIIRSISGPIQFYWKYDNSYENYYKVTINSGDGDIYCFPFRIESTENNIRRVRVGCIIFSDQVFNLTVDEKYRSFSPTSSTSNASTFTDSDGNTLYGGVYARSGIYLDYYSGDIYTDPADDPLTTVGFNDLSTWWDTAIATAPVQNNPPLWFRMDLGYMLVTLEPVVPDDPYEGIPDSDVDGGGGDFDDSSIPIDFPSLPAISVADGGFVTIYTPTLAQIKDVNNYLWQVYDPDPSITLPRILGSIMDIFIGLSILPITIPSTNTKQVLLGGHATGLNLPVADSQFIDVSFGTLEIKTGTGGSYLDYSPYTKAQIFLPYIGFRDISIDDIMGKTLELRYRVDIVSGACLALLKCGTSVLYQWTGNCAINIPLTGVDYTNTYRSALSAVGHIGQVVAGVAGTVATGGAAAPIGLGVAGNGLAGLASDALSAKPEYPRSGSLGGPAGVMGHQMAYICLTRPNVIKPKNQQGFVGYPCFITYTISDLEGQGFTQFSDVILDGVELTREEVEELARILKGGVYL